MNDSKYRRWGIQAYWLFAVIYWEILAHAAMFGQFRRGFLYALGFSAAAALALGTLVSFLPKKTVVPVSAVLSGAVMVLYGSQMVYCFIFGTPYSVSQMGLGADAMTSFWREMLQSMLDHILWLLGLLVPFGFLALLRRWRVLEKPSPIQRFVSLVFAPVLVLAVWGLIRSGGTAMYSDYYFLTNSGSTTAQTMERFGVPATFLLEKTRPNDNALLVSDDLFPSVEPMLEVKELPQIPETIEAPQVTEVTQAERETKAAEETGVTEAPTEEPTEKPTETPTESPAQETTEAPTEEFTEESTQESTEAVTEPSVPEETAPSYNVLDIDFEALSQQESNERVASMHRYFAQTQPSNKNQYTGAFRDYNLIVICAESFSPAALDPEVTPTLYKMAHEGFIFNNFYNSYPNTTTNGEYALLQGLYPDPTLDKYNSSMLASLRNELPFTLGNAFSSQLGVTCRGYHNYTGDYYSRALTHPNMGYQMKFNHDGMELESYWPNSDLEMMEQSVDDYIHEKQFHAYYMTFSGHYQYSKSTNAMVARNYDRVKDLPGYNETQKSYLACHMELDKAMEYLLRRLEEEGIADRTMVVLVSDHYPYGLQEEDYFGMLDRPKDFFEKYKSTLICWVGGMEPVEVDEYCCNVDIVPTLLNMWGLDYDSRLLSGTDVFSDSLHAAVLVDRSFLTDKVWFNSNSGEIRYQVDESQVPQGYVDSMNKLISTRYELAKEIVRYNYFGLLFPEE